METLKYLYESDCPVDAEASQFAAGGGHVEILQYLYENGYPVDTDEASLTAVEVGHQRAAPSGGHPHADTRAASL